MASVEKFSIDLEIVCKEIELRLREVKLREASQYANARIIQAWFRGIRTRNHIRKLRRAAILIQSTWRGFFSRKVLEQYRRLREAYDYEEYRGLCATRIQALWRGYHERKIGIDLQKFNKWVKSIYQKNGETLERMRRYREREVECEQRKSIHEAIRWTLSILFKSHHLLSTKNRPGVVKHIFPIEEILRSFKYKTCMKNNKVDDPVRVEKPFLLQGTRYERCERDMRNHEQSVNVADKGEPLSLIESKCAMNLLSNYLS